MEVKNSASKRREERVVNRRLKIVGSVWPARLVCSVNLLHVENLHVEVQDEEYI